MSSAATAPLRSVSQLLGLAPAPAAHPVDVPAIALKSSRVDPDDYPPFARAAKHFNTEIQSLYLDALSRQQAQEKIADRYYLERATDFVELNEQVETSATLLDDLSSFLATFQTDLSAVSGHIAELQGCSKAIEGRLASRRDVERSLHPLLVSIGISPALINTIMDTEVSEDWVPTVLELDAKLGAIRSGPRVESRKLLDDVAESLRIRASQKILNHFINLLRPYSLSPTLPLPELQSHSLLPLKPLFDFIRRHAARQAHEFQKAYVSTIRWYYETGFRRYVRALEKVRLRVVEKPEDIGNIASASKNSLALLSKRNGPTLETPAAPVTDNSRIAGPEILNAVAAESRDIRPSPEALFRSISLVLMDNAESEYTFISAFFGHHSSLPLLPKRASPTLFSSSSNSSRSTPSLASPTVPTIALPESESEARSQNGARRNSLDDGSEWGSERLGSSRATIDGRSVKLRKAVVEGIWKSVMEPALEYARNFSSALIDPIAPSPLSLLAMIRLNDALIKHLVTEENCPPMESTLMGIMLSLWPCFSEVMNAQVVSLQKIKGTLPTGAIIIALRYTQLFNGIVELMSVENSNDELVFSNLLRVRQELLNLLSAQSAKISDPAKSKAFLATHYEEILAGLSLGTSRHPRSQKEIAHWRELLRKV